MTDLCEHCWMPVDASSVGRLGVRVPVPADDELDGPLFTIDATALGGPPSTLRYVERCRYWCRACREHAPAFARPM